MSTKLINMAIDLLDEEPILSATDDRAVVNWMNRNYEPVRDSLLRLHPWNFARRRAQLAPRVTGPAFGFRYAYPKPADCVRVLPLASLGAVNGGLVRFQIEGPDILCDVGPVLKIFYVMRVDDEGSFDPLFTQYFAATLASRAAQFVTGKQNYAERVGQIAKDLRLDAQMINGLEGVPEETYSEDWINGRQTGVVPDGCGWGGYGIYR